MKTITRKVACFRLIAMMQEFETRITYNPKAELTTYRDYAEEIGRWNADSIARSCPLCRAANADCSKCLNWGAVLMYVEKGEGAGEPCLQFIEMVNRQERLFWKAGLVLRFQEELYKWRYKKEDS